METVIEIFLLPLTAGSVCGSRMRTFEKDHSSACGCVGSSFRFRDLLSFSVYGGVLRFLAPLSTVGALDVLPWRSARCSFPLLQGLMFFRRQAVIARARAAESRRPSLRPLVECLVPLPCGRLLYGIEMLSLKYLIC